MKMLPRRLTRAGIELIERMELEADARLDAVCLKALAKRPADRLASMQEFAEALDEYSRGESTASPQRKQPQRRPRETGRS